MRTKAYTSSVYDAIGVLKVAKEENKTGHRFVKSCIFFLMILLSLILLSNPVSAAHTFDTSATDGTTTFATSPNPRILSYTAGTGSTVMVLNIFTATNTARTGGDPTFNGKTFTQVGTRQPTAGSTVEGAVEMWYLLLDSGDTGSAHDISVPNTGSRAMRIHASTYKSATGASALDVYAQRPNTGTTESNPSQSITTTADGDVLVDAMFNGYSSAPTANSHTLIYSQDGGSYSANSQYYLQTTAGAQALSWTVFADDFALITASFKGVASTYTISGYITNHSSGSPLNGATVTTNTSLSTTTNAAGYYNFTGLSNGTYNITASLTGFYNNSAIATINGANLSNTNITLTPVTYTISGYVTNQSSGSPLNGATVTTNTSLNTTTNITGYYNFTGLYNGTYNITASLTGYYNNSTIATINGVDLGNVNISLSPVPTYFPPTPTGLSSTQGNFWINYTWNAGTGNVTNSYNVNVNGTWTNGSSTTYNNNSGLAPHGWSNISVYSYNSSGTGTLNTTPVSQNAQLSNNPVTIGNVLTSYTLTAGNTLSISPTSNDLDSDTLVFARNFTDGTFYTNNGTLLWTTTESDIGNNSWQINVSDGYGSVSLANFMVTVNPVPPPPPPGPLYSSHRLYKNETTPVIFCSKCHSASNTSVSSSVHNPINCLCHGYNPNQTAQYNVNVKHNLTRNIYCTNCHTKYNETTGDITIKPGISGKNQSAHYIIKNKTDPQLYNNSRGFFSR